MSVRFMRAVILRPKQTFHPRFGKLWRDNLTLSALQLVSLDKYYCLLIKAILCWAEKFGFAICHGRLLSQYMFLLFHRGLDGNGDTPFNRGPERRRELVRSQTLPRNIGAQARRSIFERLDSENNRYSYFRPPLCVYSVITGRFQQPFSCRESFPSFPLSSLSSHYQPAQASWLQAQTETLPELRRVQCQQYQANSAGVVPLQNHWIPSERHFQSVMPSQSISVSE